MSDQDRDTYPAIPAPMFVCPNHPKERWARRSVGQTIPTCPQCGTKLVQEKPKEKK